MKAAVIRQRRSPDLPDKRDCRHVPKFVQAPDTQKLFLITGFISFPPPPPCSTSANVSKPEQNPNQFQVFRETQRGSSAPGSHPESTTAPGGPAAPSSPTSLEYFSHPTHWAHGVKEETSEPRLQRRPHKHLLRQPWASTDTDTAPKDPEEERASLCLAVCTG